MRNVYRMGTVTLIKLSLIGARQRVVVNITRFTILAYHFIADAGVLCWCKLSLLMQLLLVDAGTHCLGWFSLLGQTLFVGSIIFC